MPGFAAYPEKASPAEGDFLLVLDGDDAATKKVDVGNLPSGGTSNVSLSYINPAEESIVGILVQGDSTITGTIDFSGFIDPTPLYEASERAVFFRVIQPRIYLHVSAVADPDSNTAVYLGDAAHEWLSTQLLEVVTPPTVPGYEINSAYVTIASWESRTGVLSDYGSTLDGDPAIFQLKAGGISVSNAVPQASFAADDSILWGGAVDYWGWSYQVAA